MTVVTDELAVVAATKTSLSDAGIAVCDLPENAHTLSIADRAEGAIQFVSRWAGILAFCAAIGAITYLIF
jgi:hypothetical protein